MLESAEGAQPRADRHLIFAVLAVSLLTFVMQFSMVSVALRELIQDLHAPLRWGGWVLTIFMVGQVIAMPAAGRLTERLGARAVFAGGFGLFAAASLVAAVAPNIYVLIGARAVQGLAGGGLMPSGMHMIADAYGEGRQRAIGLFASILPFGAVAGPGIGGLIAEHFGWRWTFAFHAPIGVVVFIAAFTILPRGQRRAGQRIDVAGIVLLGVALSALIFALTELGLRDPAPSPLRVGVSLALAALVGAALVLHERRTAVPLVDLELLNRREFFSPNAISFCMGFAWLGAFQLLPLYVQTAYGMGQAESGALNAPRAAFMGVASTLAALVIVRTGYRRPLIVGLLGLAIALFAISRGLHTPSLGGMAISNFWWLMGIVVVAGTFYGLCNPALQNASIDIAPDRIAAIAGLRGMFQSVGGTIGISISVLFASRAASTQAGLELAFTVYAVVMLLVPLLVLGIAENPHRSGVLARGTPTPEEEPEPALGVASSRTV